MTTTTETPTVHESRRGKRMASLFSPSRELLIPLAATGIPKAIVEPNQAAHEAVAKAEDARRRARELEAEAAAAPRHDAFALDAATAAGEEPPTPTADAKRAKAELAREQTESADRVAKAAIWELYNTIAEHYPAYLLSREEATEAAAAQVREALAAITDAWPALVEQMEILDLARRWHCNPQSAALSKPHRRPGGISRLIEKAQATERDARPNRPVERRVANLLAALEVEVERGIGS